MNDGVFVVFPLTATTIDRGALDMRLSLLKPRDRGTFNGIHFFEKRSVRFQGTIFIALLEFQ